MLELVITNSSDLPIYEQIASQLRDAILMGELAQGEKLPSIRALANDLRVSVITTKRAYTDLEAQGFIETVTGKGSFVAGGNLELLREQRRRTVEDLLAQALNAASAGGISKDEVREMLDVMIDDA